MDWQDGLRIRVSTLHSRFSRLAFTHTGRIGPSPQHVTPRENHEGPAHRGPRARCRLDSPSESVRPQPQLAAGDSAVSPAQDSSGASATGSGKSRAPGPRTCHETFDVLQSWSAPTLAGCAASRAIKVSVAVNSRWGYGDAPGVTASPRRSAASAGAGARRRAPWRPRGSSLSGTAGRRRGRSGMRANGRGDDALPSSTSAAALGSCQSAADSGEKGAARAETADGRLRKSAAVSARSGARRRATS
jgi:hypothetical protein